MSTVIYSVAFWMCQRSACLGVASSLPVNEPDPDKVQNTTANTVGQLMFKLVHEFWQHSPGVRPGAGICCDSAIALVDFCYLWDAHRHCSAGQGSLTLHIVFDMPPPPHPSPHSLRRSPVRLYFLNTISFTVFVLLLSETTMTRNSWQFLSSWYSCFSFLVGRVA